MYSIVDIFKTGLTKKPGQKFEVKKFWGILEKSLIGYTNQNQALKQLFYKTSFIHFSKKLDTPPSTDISWVFRI